LTLQLQQKDEMMVVMKSRTRDFVNNLKEEHATAIRGLQEQLVNREEVRCLHAMSVLSITFDITCTATDCGGIRDGFASSEH
jgi:hypothetical protein